MKTQEHRGWINVYARALSNALSRGARSPRESGRWCLEAWLGSRLDEEVREQLGTRRDGVLVEVGDAVAR